MVGYDEFFYKLLRAQEHITNIEVRDTQLSLTLKQHLQKQHLKLLIGKIFLHLHHTFIGYTK
jgi:hypothetical protein